MLCTLCAVHEGYNPKPRPLSRLLFYPLFTIYHLCFFAIIFYRLEEDAPKQSKGKGGKGSQQPPKKQDIEEQKRRDDERKRREEEERLKKEEEVERLRQFEERLQQGPSIHECCKTGNFDRVKLLLENKVAEQE